MSAKTFPGRPFDSLDLTLRLIHLARIYDAGYDDLGATGSAIRAVLNGAPVDQALGLDLDDDYATTLLERTRP